MVRRKNCQRALEAEYRTNWKTKSDEAVDIDRKLGAYDQLNTTLSTPNVIHSTPPIKSKLINSKLIYSD